MLDLVAESIDVALRIGELKSSSIVARNLAPPCGTSSPRRPISPARAAREPAELAEHACVLLNASTPRPSGSW